MTVPSTVYPNRAGDPDRRLTAIDRAAMTGSTRVSVTPPVMVRPHDGGCLRRTRSGADTRRCGAACPASCSGRRRARGPTRDRGDVEPRLDRVARMLDPVGGAGTPVRVRVPRSTARVNPGSRTPARQGRPPAAAIAGSSGTEARLCAAAVAPGAMMHTANSVAAAATSQRSRIRETGIGTIACATWGRSRRP